MAGEQPSNNEAYVQPENAVTRDPLEEKASKHLEHHDDPSKTNNQTGGGGGDAIPSSLGRGVTNGSGPVDAHEASATTTTTTTTTTKERPQNENVNAEEQMATLGEGQVADAVQRKSGTQQVPGQGPAEEQDFASDLDRKKAEQAGARAEMKEARRLGVNVDGGAGGGGGRLGDETLNDA